MHFDDSDMSLLTANRKSRSSTRVKALEDENFFARKRFFDPQKNIDFYTQILGLRLVKLTVNFDDPTTYHLYFGGDARVQSLLSFHGQMRLKDIEEQDKSSPYHFQLLNIQ
jgi:hypothetical protein